jgi:hypothetical protein
VAATPTATGWRTPAAARRSDQRRGRADDDARVDAAAPQERVGEPAARDHACQRAEPDHRRERAGRCLAKAVARAQQDDREDLYAGKEQVRDRGRGDEDHVGADPQHVTDGRAQWQLGGVAVQNQVQVGLDAALLHDPRGCARVMSV